MISYISGMRRLPRLAMTGSLRYNNGVTVSPDDPLVQSFAQAAMDHLEQRLASLDKRIEEVQESPEGDDTMINRARVPIGFDEFGKPIMKQIKANSEYELMLKGAKLMLDAGVLDQFLPHDRSTPTQPEKSSVTVREMGERWFKIYKQDNDKLKPASKANYRYMMDRYIFSAIGDKNIADITHADLQQMLNGLKQIAASQQRSLIVTVRQIFEMAVQERIIDRNPGKGKLTLTGVEKKEGRALTRGEWLKVQSLLPEMEEPDRLFIALMLYEGMRRSEALGLEWSHVDFEAHVIHIVQQAAFNNGNNNATIQSPKTKTSTRDVPMPEPLEKLLRETEHKGRFIVGNADTPYTKSMMTKALRRVKKITSIEDLHPHMFRYSHATMLHELGVDDKTIQTWEGHASQSTTQNFYIKQSNAMTERASRKLEKFASEA